MSQIRMVMATNRETREFWGLTWRDGQVIGVLYPVYFANPQGASYKPPPVPDWNEGIGWEVESDVTVEIDLPGK